MRFRITGFQDQPSTIVASRHLLDGNGLEPLTLRPIMRMLYPFELPVLPIQISLSTKFNNDNQIGFNLYIFFRKNIKPYI